LGWQRRAYGPCPGAAVAEAGWIPHLHSTLNSYWRFVRSVGPCTVEGLKRQACLLNYTRPAHLRTMSLASPAPPVTAQPGPAHTPQSIPLSDLRAALKKVLAGKDLNTISLKDVREQVCLSCGFSANALDPRREEFKKMTTEVVQTMLQGPHPLTRLTGEVEDEGMAMV